MRSNQLSYSAKLLEFTQVLMCCQENSTGAVKILDGDGYNKAMADLQTHRRRYLILLLLVCPLAAYVFVPRPPDFSVRTRAKRLMPASQWEPSRLAGGISYTWLSTYDVLVSHGRGRIGIVDMRTGIERPLKGLDNAFLKRPELAQIVGQFPGWLISPDRQWLLTYTATPRGQIWVASTLDGGRIVEIPSPLNQYPLAIWDRNSRGFVQIASFGRLLFARHYSLDGPNVAASIPIGRGARDVPLHMPPLRFNDTYEPLGEFAQDYLLVANFSGYRGAARFLIYNLRAPHRPSPIYFGLPPHAVPDEIEMSPNGNRIGWILDFQGGADDPRLRRLPFMPIGPGHGLDEVWVSNLDGSDMHPIATAGTEKDASGPTNLRWTVDSKSVTFLYSGALYAASAG